MRRRTLALTQLLYVFSLFSFYFCLFVLGKRIDEFYFVRHHPPARAVYQNDFLLFPYFMYTPIFRRIYVIFGYFRSATGRPQYLGIVRSSHHHQGSWRDTCSLPFPLDCLPPMLQVKLANDNVVVSC
jgi:hypothetical protein